MNQSDYTDYHQISWDLPKPPLTKVGFLAKRLFYILPYCLLTLSLSAQLSSRQTLIVRQELTFVYFLVSLFILLIVVTLDYLITTGSGQSIDRYRLSKNGLRLNRKTIPLSKLSSSKIDLLIKSPSRYVRQEYTHFEIKLPLNRGFVTLRLPDQTTVKKLFLSLQHYLNL